MTHHEIETFLQDLEHQYAEALAAGYGVGELSRLWQQIRYFRSQLSQLAGS